MSDRGIKKWAPYKSLVEHGYALNDLSNENKKIDKPTISRETAEEINELLCEYHGQEVIITYYRRGNINDTTEIIKKIDTLEKKLVLSNRQSIKFSELLYIKNA